ncbi:MAG: sensor histidine kinase [Candidatus Dormibacteria bacterium]
MPDLRHEETAAQGWDPVEPEAAEAPTPGLPEAADQEGATGSIRRELQRVDLELLEAAAFSAHFERRLLEAGTELEAARGRREAALAHLSRLSPEDVSLLIEEETRALRKQQAQQFSRENLESRCGHLESLRAFLAGLVEELDREHEPREGASPGAGARIFLLIEDERLRIARDLHDGPAQSMANLVFKAEILDRLVDSPEKLQDELNAFKQGVRQALEDTRRFIFDLRPMTLDDLGLVPTFRKYLQEYQDKFAIETQLNVKGEERRLPGNLEVTVFRIFQEALSNAQKHASPKLVTVNLNQAAGRLTLRVRDDGSGFVVDEAPELAVAERRLGLVGMRERAEQHGGRLELKSSPGEGTEVLAEFQLP